MTQSIVPGEAVYGEKKVSVEVSCLSVCRMYSMHGIKCVCVGHPVCDKCMQSVKTVQRSTAW